MQFSNFTRIEENLTIIFKNEIPLERVASIKYYKDNSGGLFSKKEFRWSFNNTYWSAWEVLTQSAISSINMHSNYYLFLQIKYTLTAVDSGIVSSFNLYYIESDAVTPVISYHDDIETQDTSAIIIHDFIQHHTFSSIIDACTLNGYRGSWYLNRTHHTGYQPISTVTGLQNALNALANSTFVKEASLGDIFIWDSSGFLDISIAGDVTKVYVDASLNAIRAEYVPDISLGNDFEWDASGYLQVVGGTGNLDVSGNLHTTGTVKIDGSINVSGSFYADSSIGWTGTFLANSSTVTIKNGIIISVI